MSKYLCNLFYVVLVILLPILFFSWWAEPLSINGDLTRIGKWTEHDFGPNATHPSLHIKANSQDQQNPEVMVLGDSFSVGNIWQSVLSDNTGYVVKSFHYESNCITNWIRAATTESNSKFIVIEAVERSFIEKFSNVPRCDSKKTIPLEIHAGIESHERPTWPPTLSLPYLLPSLINTVELNTSRKKYFNRFQVVNVPLKLGCSLFSNRRNNRLLYYSEDDLKRQWSLKQVNTALANILKIQNEVERHGKKFIFIVAPDKSSVYQSCLIDQFANKNEININEMLISSGINAPDMQTLFESNKNLINDLYIPDGTHWSLAGYVLAGEAISEYFSRPLLRN